MCFEECWFLAALCDAAPDERFAMMMVVIDPQPTVCGVVTAGGFLWGDEWLFALLQQVFVDGVTDHC